MLELDDIDLLDDADNAPGTPTRQILDALHRAEAPRLTLRAMLAEHDTAALKAEAERLATLTHAEITTAARRLKIAIEATSQQVKPETRLGLWQLSEEFTRRGIPPIFRLLPEINDDDPSQIADLFAIDLSWLAAEFPKHKPLLQKWAGIFKSTRFHSTADFIAGNYPRKAMHWLCKGLGLTDDQQRRLHVIKTGAHRRAFEALQGRRQAVRTQLATKYHERAKDVRYRADDPKATIERRAAVWFAGSLADWKPQPTADLYRALTGEALTRQLAAKVIEQVRRDIPNA